MDSPMSPLEAFKSTSLLCLSPQDKLKSSSSSSSLLAQRAAATATAATKKDAATLLDASSIDFDSGWVSDDNLRTLDLDDCLAQDIDWVDSSLSFNLGVGLDSATTDESDDDDAVSDFGFGASRASTAYLSPLQSELSLALDATADDASNDLDVASSFDYSVLRLEPLTTDAETLLMSFDTMHFPLPSLTTNTKESSTKRRASLFGASSAAKRQRLASSALTPTATTAASNEPVLDVLSLVTSAPLSTGVSSAASSLPVTATTATATTSNKMIGAYTPDARRLRIAQFHAKRKRRTWKKSIKYDCRKKLADDRPRIKGRFVKVHDDDGGSIGTMVDIKDECSDNGAMSPDSVVAFTPAPAIVLPQAFSSASVGATAITSSPVVAHASERPVGTSSDSVRLAPAVEW